MAVTVREESEDRKRLREWRQAERKHMIDAIHKLIDQSVKLATSQYTRSSERAKWSRLAGQQIWYKNQLMDSFDWEALDRDLNNLKKRVLESQIESLKKGVSRPTWSPDLKKPDTIGAAKPPEEPPEPPDIFTEAEEKETT